jgi:uncharacterized protein YukJ
MLADFGVLKGTVHKGEEERHDSQSPHFYWTVAANERHWSVPVNIKSSKEPYNVLFHVETDFRHPLLEDLKILKTGFTGTKKHPQLGIDFLRSELFDLGKFKPVPFDKPGSLNDLFDFFMFYTQKASREKAEVFIFGDKIEGKDILHDVHMNQGNDGYFQKFKGIYQDGAIFFRFSNVWTAIFLAFQTQSVPTDTNGHPLQHSKPILQAEIDFSEPLPEPEIKKCDLVILGALVNPKGKDFGAEIVYLFNKEAAEISLDGWKLEDKHGKTLHLDQLTVQGRSLCAVPLDGKGVQLSNKGGILSLITPQNMKCHGVSYTAAEVSDGKVLIFKNI